MRAVRLHQFGSPEVLRLEEVADPKPGAGQVLIEVSAVGVQFLETQIRAGKMPGAGSGAFPLVLGREIAGVVVGAGSDEHLDLVGRRVLGSTEGLGGYAERAVVPANSVIEIPTDLSTEDAVALYRYGCTAAGLIRAARIGKGDHVLIEAAGGAVGTLLIQLAKAAGAETVIATARGEHKLELARQLGADICVDYSLPGWEKQVQGGVDVVFDHIGGTIARTSFGLLTGGTGRFVFYGLSGGTMVDIKPQELLGRGLTLTGFTTGQIWNRPDYAAELVSGVLEEAVAGRLRPVVGQTFPLAETAAAHSAIEARQTVGKTLLIP